MRMGAKTPKQFLPLAGKPILYWSIKAFAAALRNVSIVVVLPQTHMEEGRSVLQLFEGGGPEMVIVPGGETRYASVAAGLAQASSPSVVLVHDAARPMITGELIRRCYETACVEGSAIPVIPVADSIRQISGHGSHMVTRDNLRIVQTPQAFDVAILRDAFAQPYRPVFTDEASVVEWSGRTIRLVDGARNNFKITTLDDLLLAEALMRERLAAGTN